MINHMCNVTAIYFQERTSLIALSTWILSLGNGLTSPQSLKDCLSQRNIMASVKGNSLQYLKMKMIILMVMRTCMGYPMAIWRMGVMGCLMDTCQLPQLVSEKMTIRKRIIIGISSAPL